VILALFIALTALMALVCFGLSVLVIEVVGRLWDKQEPVKPRRHDDGVSQTTKQRAAKIS
jgi:hypothetical protein